MSSEKKDDRENEQIAGFTPVGATDGVSHALHPNSPSCPNCGAPPGEHEVQNYSMIWHDGNVYCKKCNAYVRAYDAG